MDAQRNSLLAMAYQCHGKTLEELRQSLLCKTMEVETTRAAAQQELRRRDEQLARLRDLLSRAIQERDEAREKCQSLIDRRLLRRLPAGAGPLSGVSTVDDEPRRGVDSNNAFSSSDCEESIVSSPVFATPEILPEKPLPEKGKLLQAVMKAGPLLQTLLLAGPLPQWRHPPPPIDTLDIPPVAIPSPPHYLLAAANLDGGSCGRVTGKRGGFCEGSMAGREAKLPRVVLH